MASEITTLVIPSTGDPGTATPIEVYPKTIARQVYDEARSQYLPITLAQLEGQIETNGQNITLVDNKVDTVESLANAAANTAAQALQAGVDAKETIVDAINAKGGAVTEDNSFSELAMAISAISPGKKFAMGTATSSAVTVSYELSGSTGTTNIYSVEVTGLDFTPENIIIVSQTNNTLSLVYRDRLGVLLSFYVASITGSGNTSAGSLKANARAGYVNSTGFRVGVFAGNHPFSWIAYE